MSMLDKNNHQPPNVIRSNLSYAGFWLRTGATLLDALLIVLITSPILILIYGWGYFDSTEMIQGGADFLISWLSPAIATVLFWLYFGATPAKMAFSLKVVDAVTGEKPTLQQCVIRYLGYFVSMLPLFLGFFWIIWDGNKQGWHDKMAKTVVIRHND